MRCKKLVFALVATLSLSAPAAYAGTPGYVTAIGVNIYGTAFLLHSGTRSNVPSCQSTTVADRWNFDATTPTGQAILATLLSAYHAHKPVIIDGTGSCSIWSDTETVLQVLSS